MNYYNGNNIIKNNIMNPENYLNNINNYDNNINYKDLINTKKII